MRCKFVAALAGHFYAPRRGIISQTNTVSGLVQIQAQYGNKPIPYCCPYRRVFV
ncbi:MAG: hypothetical protein JOY54_04345 [Acidobacteriaceae bacterium]|nr:hypothetical protein [Acidobacteriaceae bacterium]